MIITKADIGRKAVARNGEVCTYKGKSENPDCPHNFLDSHGLAYEYRQDGQFWGFMISKHDLIRWADESEDAQ